MNRLSTKAAAAFLAVVWIASGACYAYRVAAVAPASGTRVRIVLVSATVVTTVGPDGTRRTHAGVLEASGTIAAAAGDTVALRVDELRSATGPLPEAAGHVALLPTAQIARLEERRFQAGTTALAGVGASTLALAVFITVVIVGLTKGF